MSHRLHRHTCEDAFRRLDDYLDRRLSPDDMRQIEDHLRICDACTREFTFEASVLEGVKQKLRHLPAPPSDLLNRILARLSAGEGGQNA